MGWENRVVWTEGMFLRPQHFQQFTRYAEAFALAKTGPLVAHGWGLIDLEIDEGLLKTGKVALTKAVGITEDGFPFDVPRDCDHPAPLIPDAGLKNAVIYLAIPVRRAGAPEVSLGTDDATQTRYLASEFDLFDSVAGAPGRAPIDVGKLRFRLMHDQQDLSGFSTIPLARLVERRADDTLVLDAGFVPTSLCCSASTQLLGYLSELKGLMHHRAEAISARLGVLEGGSISALTDFLILQVCNRYEGVLNHLAELPVLHPERLYASFIEAAADLATFTGARNRLGDVPVYNHRDLRSCFQPMLDILRQALGNIIDPDTVSIKLEPKPGGFWAGRVTRQDLFVNSVFVLAAKADVDSEVLRQTLPRKTTLGSLQTIRDMVNLAIKGVPIRPARAEPRQIPYRANMVYFELNTNDEKWKEIRTTGALGLHVSDLADNLPGLKLELWAIKGQVK